LALTTSLGLDLRQVSNDLAAAVSGLLRALPDFTGTELVISGASGAHAATGAERQALREQGNHAVRAFSTLTGHMKEAQFPFAIALAALALSNNAAYPPFDADNEAPARAEPMKAVATAIGYNRFEGAAVLARA